MALVLARGDGVQADGADDRGVGEGGLGRDDGVGDEVVDALEFTLAWSSSLRFVNSMSPSKAFHATATLLLPFA